jgi:quercetin dioxygenase-like cupin family protein
VSETAATAGSFASLPADEPYPGVVRRSFSSRHATVANYVFSPGARFPLHSHSQEQITLVEEGEVTMTMEGESRRLVAGEWSVVAPHVEHGVRAGREGARIVAIVVPRRNDPDDLRLRADGEAGP